MKEETQNNKDDDEVLESVTSSKELNKMMVGVNPEKPADPPLDAIPPEPPPSTSQLPDESKLAMFQEMLLSENQSFSKFIAPIVVPPVVEVGYAIPVLTMDFQDQVFEPTSMSAPGALSLSRPFARNSPSPVHFLCLHLYLMEVIADQFHIHKLK